MRGRPSGAPGWTLALTGLISQRPELAGIGLGPAVELTAGAA